MWPWIVRIAFGGLTRRLHGAGIFCNADAVVTRLEGLSLRVTATAALGYFAAPIRPGTGSKPFTVLGTVLILAGNLINPCREAKSRRAGRGALRVSGRPQRQLHPLDVTPGLLFTASIAALAFLDVAAADGSSAESNASGW